MRGRSTRGLARVAAGGLLLALLLPAAAPAGAQRPASGAVLRVVDGDTLDVQLAEGKRERVRVLGIDTPETVDPR